MAKKQAAAAIWPAALLVPLVSLLDGLPGRHAAASPVPARLCGVVEEAVPRPGAANRLHRQVQEGLHAAGGPASARTSQPGSTRLGAGAPVTSAIIEQLQVGQVFAAQDIALAAAARIPAPPGGLPTTSACARS
jgi:hypothetical protein